MLAAVMSAQTGTPRTVEKGDQSNIEAPRQVLVRTEAELRQLWQQHAPDRPMPTIDFSRDMLIVLASGLQGCLLPPPSLVRLSLNSRTGKLDALVHSDGLPPGAGCLPDMAAPAVVYRTAWTERPVHFVDEASTAPRH